MIIRPELKLIPSFKKLITRDKDRYKHKSIAEFAFIYFMYDYKSPYMSLSTKDRREQIIKHLKFDTKWEPDEEVAEAIKQYLEFQLTPSIKALNSTKEALLNASRVIDVMNETVDISLHEDTKDMTTAIETIEKLLTLAEKLPKTINTIVTLEKKVQEEQHETSKVRGGGQAGLYEN